MSTVGIVDVDLLSGRQHRFPNLAAMKLSAYYKNQGKMVNLISSYRDITNFDEVLLCCVFTESSKTVPGPVLSMEHVVKGGTGFFFDKAPALPQEVEHTKPDYTLYSTWAKGQNPSNTPYYTEASIGFLSRGCFRRCKFCINRNLRKAQVASPLDEFYDASRPRVCLLDDNILALQGHLPIIESLAAVCEENGTKFELKQGIDIRLLKTASAKVFCSPSHFGEIIFAFDNIKEAKSVCRGVTILREQAPKKSAKAYVLCGYDSQDWRDIATVFRRLEILWAYQCLGYVMRHKRIHNAPPVYRNLYTQIAAWANQPQFQRAVSFRQFCEKARGKVLRSLHTFEARYLDVAKRFFDQTYSKTPRAF